MSACGMGRFRRSLCISHAALCLSLSLTHTLSLRRDTCARSLSAHTCVYLHVTVYSVRTRYTSVWSIYGVYLTLHGGTTRYVFVTRERHHRGVNNRLPPRGPLSGATTSLHGRGLRLIPYLCLAAGSWPVCKVVLLDLLNWVPLRCRHSCSGAKELPCG